MERTEGQIVKRHRKLRRPSRRMGRMLLSLGLTGAVLSIVLLGAAFWLGNRNLVVAAFAYLFTALAVLCLRELRKRVYQIKKRKYARR